MFRIPLALFFIQRYLTNANVYKNMIIKNTIQYNIALFNISTSFIKFFIYMSIYHRYVYSGSSPDSYCHVKSSKFLVIPPSPLSNIPNSPYIMLPIYSLIRLEYYMIKIKPSALRLFAPQIIDICAAYLRFKCIYIRINGSIQIEVVPDILRYL